MRTYALIGAFAALIAASGGRVCAQAPPPVTVPKFTFGFGSGLFYAADNEFAATWYRPMMLEFDIHFDIPGRDWLNRVTIYGLLNLELATFDFSRKPGHMGGDLAGIHRSEMLVGPYLTGGGGLRLSVIERKRWHLGLFAEVTTMFSAAPIATDAMVIDVSGLQIDVAKTIRQHTAPTFHWRTITYGATVSRDFTVRGRTVSPYVSLGGVSYRSEIVFKIDPALEDALKRVKIDPKVLAPRIDDQTKPFGVLGVKTEITPRWTFDVASMIGRFGDTWIVSVHAGALINF
jgi:hypothetical protein